MDFSLTEEQTMFRDLFRDFAEKEIAKVAEHVDRSEEPPLELFKKAAAQGFFGAPIPETYGGVGIDWLSYSLMSEEFGKHCLSTAITIGLHTSLAALSIRAAGTEEQKQRYLPALAAGEMVGALALTEPEAGSDSGAVTTTATKVEGGYRLNGTKTWVTNGGLGGLTMVLASTKPGAGQKGLSVFIVPNQTEGLTIGYRERTLGLRGLDIRTLYFENVFVPDAALLGEEHGGWAVAKPAFDRVRLTLAAIALGAAEACLALGVTFAAERKQFGVAIAHKQAMQNYVAEAAIEIEALRGLVRQAAWLADTGQDFSQAASIAKYHGARTAKDVANKMLQVHGGYGFSDEYAISRYYRDVRALRIMGGTDEMQRQAVAQAAFADKGLLLQP
jgi:alkylation response protein AidB-like acyl-CoA dehydrogenase